MSTEGKSILCRAAVVWTANTPWIIETVTVDAPKTGEVRVKLASSGLCHTDYQMMQGVYKDFPAVLGHEGAGYVESIGEGVTTVDQGNLVVLLPVANCGDCDHCRSPLTINCRKQTKDNLQLDGTSRFSCKGQRLTQMQTLGTFSEYTVVSQFNVSKVNPAANPKSLCLIGCCVPTGYGAPINTAHVQPGSSCAVWGLGGIGMCVVMGCRDSGASKIIGVDINPRKFPIAKQFGCTDFLNPKEVSSVEEKLAEMTNGGVEYCFVAVGHIPAMEQAFRSSHPNWGKTIVIGIANMGDTMNAGIRELLLGRQLLGTAMGGFKGRVSTPDLTEKAISGQIPLDSLITHRMPLERINEGYEILEKGESLRTIIDFDLRD